MFTQSCSNVKAPLIAFNRICFDLSVEQRPAGGQQAAGGDYNDDRQDPKLRALGGA